MSDLLFVFPLAATTAYIDLAWWQVAIAASLILINAAVSLALRLDLGKRFLVASVRLTLQLILVGYVLQWIFTVNQPAAVLAIVALMTTIAGLSAVGRSELRYPGIYVTSLISVWASSWIVAAIAVVWVVQPDPWWRPQYLIPLVGMILGNALTGISLGLDRFLSELSRGRAVIDGALCLGATRWEAVRPTVRSAMRTGMIPIMNAMTVAGIVSLPGMMTGQLLSGVDPMSAVKYQIVIMFLIAATVAIGTLGSIMISYRRLTNDQHAIRWDRIEKNGKS
ncbi:hypothetical protein CA51_11430 [Rosistilla oblonga]|uniref:ABC transporter permease n=1 Tax=Rosistilla oblonga TaxID=2527990 RepID=UPI001188CF6F|nr:iron export ABC transporter permease subunit FetB [Rosistilla oblonga]QDV11281.1 hypothetical protein CA51_11430 [Rosistilla oblonga]